MKKKILAVVLSTGLLGVSGMTHADLMGLGKKALGGESTTSNVSPESIVKKYIGGSQNVNKADVKMLRAVGLKDEADRVELQAKNLTEGATKDSLEEATKVQTESSKVLEARLKENKVEMDANSKQQFSSGMGDLGRGLLSYLVMSKEAAGFTPGVSSLGTSTNSAVYIVKTLPASIKSLVGTLKSSIEFAKANKIPVPKEAADATAAI